MSLTIKFRIKIKKLHKQKLFKIMGILLSNIRIRGFRGLDNHDVKLDMVTVLTGMNNTGKTSFLKALQIPLGNRMFITQDDFCISNTSVASQIIIDLKIIPIDSDGFQVNEFDADWEILFTEDRIRTNAHEESFVPLRTIVTFDAIKNSYKTKQYILADWPPFEEGDVFWFDVDNGIEKIFSFEELPFFYIDAQRDIIEDIKLRTSYLGRMLSKIEYSDEEIERIENQIRELNESAVSSSAILSNIRTTLKELDSAMDSSSEGVDITPFTKKLRDLNKGLSIYYSDQKDSFSMEYHGMGTRSWSSLLTLKSFVNVLFKKAEAEHEVFFPFISIEEPEAHLHPNAQKKLYSQIVSIPGQKVISTHSTYIAASAELSQIRNVYKDDTKVSFGKIDVTIFDAEELRKIKRQVINSRGDIFFSKVLVFFEGETEEQALPIFAEKYFGKSCVELGIDFIGVGGSGKYLPFVRVANSLKIPWYIFSDGEESAKQAVKKALEKLYEKEITIEQECNVIFLENGQDFERSIIEGDYFDEIKSMFIEIYGENYLENQIHLRNGTLKSKIKTGENCEACGQTILQDVLRNYEDEGLKEAMHDCICANKTSHGPALASHICRAGKELPTKIKELYSKIAIQIFNIEESVT